MGIGADGQKYTNAAAGIDLIYAHCESGSTGRGGIGSCTCIGARASRRSAFAASGSAMA